MTNCATRFPWLRAVGCIAALAVAPPLGIGGCGPQYTPCGDDPSALSDDDDDTGATGDDDAGDDDTVADPAPRLAIHSANPHFLEYDGVPFFTMPFDVDLSGHEHARRLDGMGLDYSVYGSSRSYCGVTWTDPENLPYVDGDMTQGFNRSYWDERKASMDEAEAAGTIVNFAMWATTRLEWGNPDEVPEGCNYDDPDHPDYWAPDRFEASLWSEQWGGPLPDDGYPKDMFYTLYDYDTFLYGAGAYDDAWPWEKKNQFRQEELLHEVYTLFADNSNWTLQLMYELHDTGGTTVDKTVAWLDHVVAYCDHLDPDRLRFYCGPCTSVDDMFATGHFDVLSGEGVTVTPDFPQQVHEASWHLDLPIVYRGFDPLNEDGVRMDNQDDIPDDYANDIGWDHNLEVMREFILWGIGPCPFFHYTEWDTHDHIDRYAQELAAFLETVQTWHDEPGDEIRDDTVPGNPLW